MYDHNGLALPQDTLPQLPSEVTDYLSHLDQRSANAALRQFGEEFGVKTAEVNGVRYMLARDLARLTYAFEHTQNLANLVQRRGDHLIEMHEVKDSNGDHSNLREQLSASIFGPTPLLATWAHVLIAGTYGQSEVAEKVRDYIKRAELYARRQAMAITETGYSMEQLATGMHEQMAEMHKIMAMIPATILQTITEVVPTMVRGIVQEMQPPIVPTVEVTIAGFWRRQQHDGWRTKHPSLTRSLAGRVRGQATRTTGANYRYPESVLDTAFQVMISEGVVYRAVRRSTAKVY